MGNVARVKGTLIEYLAREWLLAISILGVTSTSFYLKRWPRLERTDLEVIWLLAVLFVTVRGLQHSGLMQRLAWRLESGTRVPLKLTLGTFFLSMVVTNDVALIAIVPVTLMLQTPYKGWLVILEALAANAGSALTPIGNPQNLFIYWHYHVSPLSFVREIAPFSAVFLVLLVVLAIGIPTATVARKRMMTPLVNGRTWVHAGMLLLVIGCVLGLLPLYWTLLVVFNAAIFERKSLKIDFLLLATFWAFFVLADNVRIILNGAIKHPDHIFLMTALGSQLVSNVPATLLVSAHTDNWPALLWGASVGGFGSLMGSLANLIAYRLYIAQGGRGSRRFTWMFLLVGGVAFLLGVLLYFLVEAPNVR